MSAKRSIFYGLIAVVFALMFIACDNGLTGGRDDSTARTNLMVTWPDGLTTVRGKTLADIDLSAYTNGNKGTFRWASPSQKVGSNVGIFKYSMIFEPSDSARHNTAKKSVDVLVSLVDMQRIEAGSFTMGSPFGEQDRKSGEEDQWDVALSGFYMGRYEITQKEYDEVMGAGAFEKLYKNANYDWAAQDYGQGDNIPAYYISWYNALVFCNKLSIKEGLSPAYSINGNTNPDLWGAVPTANSTVWNEVTIVADSTGYRMPTEAQWEYACRGGITSAWYFGDADSRSDEYAWTYNNSTITSTGNITKKETTGRKAREVGKRIPNPQGLYDMHGNIQEVCWDWKDTYPNEARLNYMGASSSSNNYRVGRGGSYGVAPAQGRSAARGASNPWSRSESNGLRIARPEGLTPPQEDRSMDLSAIKWKSDTSGFSKLLGHYWNWRADAFPWVFKNNGTIITTHCCGAEFPEYVYLLRGNVLLTTYLGDTGTYEVKEFTYFTITDDSAYFSRDTGTKVTRYYRESAYPYTGSVPNAPVVVSNNLIGTWSGEDGTYTFGSDLSLRINSAEYGYLTWKNKIVILGPLVEGETTALKEYSFMLIGNKLSLFEGTNTVSLTGLQ